MNAPVDSAQKVSQVDLRDAALVQRIEAFVAEQGASLFHRPAWLLAVEEGAGQRATGLIVEQLGVIAGWLL